MAFPPLDLGLVRQCEVVLDHYDGVAAAARNALQARSNGMFGRVFGPDTAEVSALNAVIGAMRPRRGN